MSMRNTRAGRSEQDNQAKRHGWLHCGCTDVLAPAVRNTEGVIRTTTTTSWRLTLACPPPPTPGSGCCHENMDMGDVVTGKQWKGDAPLGRRTLPSCIAAHQRPLDCRLQGTRGARRHRRARQTQRPSDGNNRQRPKPDPTDDHEGKQRVPQWQGPSAFEGLPDPHQKNARHSDWSGGGGYPPALCQRFGWGGDEATDTQLPYDPRVTGHRSQLEPVLNVALSSPLGAIECFIGWFSLQPRLLGPDIRIIFRAEVWLGGGGRHNG